MLFTDRALADNSLNQARNHFRDVTENTDAATYPMLLRRARFGLAQVHEALGELDKAKEFYGMISKEVAGDSIASAAKKRIARLDTPETDSFYAWFANQKPVPPAATGGTSSPLGDLLDSPGAGLGDLPDSSPGDFMSTDFGSSTDDTSADDSSTGTDSGTDSGAADPPADGTTTPPAKQDEQESGGTKEAEKTGTPPTDPGKS
jgi:hypothetical protein